MGDLQEEKSEIVERISRQTVPAQEAEDKPKRKSISQILCEERIEKVHECIESKTSVEVIKGEKNYGSKANVKESAADREENPAPKEERPVKTEERSKQREEHKERGSNASIKIEEREEIQDKTETKPEKQVVSNSVVYCTKPPREKIIRNQSDIFSLKNVSTTLQTSIFSVNGCPSRKVFRKQEPAGHLFQRNDDPPADKVATPRGKRITKENYNDEKRPSSSYRNPLTGSGLSSNDEYKSKGIKRKDGNPLLGLGYDSEVATSVTSQHRIPPGGFSHKLW